jgi:hypothetical protein
MHRRHQPAAFGGQTERELPEDIIRAEGDSGHLGEEGQIGQRGGEQLRPDLLAGGRGVVLRERWRDEPILAVLDALRRGRGPLDEPPPVVPPSRNSMSFNHPAAMPSPGFVTSDVRWS